MTSSFSHIDALNALASYGADFKRWPDQELAANVQSEPALAQHINQAAELDMQMSNVDIPVASELLKARILNAARKTAQDSAPDLETSQTNPTTYSFNKLMRIAAIFLISATIGGAIWMNTAPTDDDQILSAEAQSETDAWRAAATDLDMIDIFLWVEDEEITG